MLSPDRLFNPEPSQRRLARSLFEKVAGLPIISPHGHVDASLFAESNRSFGTPVDLFIQHDHYILRMLYSHGVQPFPLMPSYSKDPNNDPRKTWQAFVDAFHLFLGTPSGLWIRHELEEVFGVKKPLTSENAQAIYDQVVDCLGRPEFSPRALFERFNIEVLCTTDRATDGLEAHEKVRKSGWKGDIRPTFRPDGLINLQSPGWKEDLARLVDASGVDVVDFQAFILALEERRRFFKEMGATATDHGADKAFTLTLSPGEVEDIFQHALRGEVTRNEADAFTAHMLEEMARMSIDDGLVMQLHAGSLRNHNEFINNQFGPDRGGDIPVQIEFTRALKSLLNRFGNDPRLTLILFTLDESAYARELAPLAGHYPAVKLGPPWWFHDSPNGMRRYFDQVMETAGLFNTAGFNDDTRAFCSVPARHDAWRRVSCDWLAGLVLQGRVEEEDAQEMAAEMAVGLAKRAYRLL